MILALRKRHRIIWALWLPLVAGLFYLALQSIPPQQEEDGAATTDIAYRLQERGSHQYLILDQGTAFDDPALVLYAYSSEEEGGLLLGNVSTRGHYEFLISLPAPLAQLRWINPLSGKEAHRLEIN